MRFYSHPPHTHSTHTLSAAVSAIRSCLFKNLLPARTPGGEGGARTSLGHISGRSGSGWCEEQEHADTRGGFACSRARFAVSGIPPTSREAARTDCSTGLRAASFPVWLDEPPDCAFSDTRHSSGLLLSSSSRSVARAFHSDMEDGPPSAGCFRRLADCFLGSSKSVSVNSFLPGSPPPSCCPAL